MRLLYISIERHWLVLGTGLRIEKGGAGFKESCNGDIINGTFKLDLESI